MSNETKQYHSLVSWKWAFKRDTERWINEMKKKKWEIIQHRLWIPYVFSRSLALAHRPPNDARLVVMSDIYFTFISIILNRKSQLWFISWVLRKITCDYMGSSEKYVNEKWRECSRHRLQFLSVDSNPNRGRLPIRKWKQFHLALQTDDPLW